MPKTTVVQLKRKNGKVLWPYDLAVTRRVKRGGWDLPQSRWANPYTVKQCGSNKAACEKFEQHLDESPELLAELPELQGLVLACFCAEDEPYCHAKILARRADKTVLGPV